jgi:hypothetical protein
MVRGVGSTRAPGRRICGVQSIAAHTAENLHYLNRTRLGSCERDLIKPCSSYDDDCPSDWKAANDRLAKLLCQACALLDKHGANKSVELDTWWKEYQKR